MMVTEGLVHNPIFYLILATGAYSSVGRVWNRYRHGDDQYHQIPKRQQTGITAAYIALVVGRYVRYAIDTYIYDLHYWVSYHTRS